LISKISPGVGEAVFSSPFRAGASTKDRGRHGCFRGRLAGVKSGTLISRSWVFGVQVFGPDRPFPTPNT
jgi:hypothetical protein